MMRAKEHGMNRAMGRQPHRMAPFARPVDTQEELSAGAIDHYWHPGRDGVEQAPEDFTRVLEGISKDVKVVRPPAGANTYFKRAWLVWYRKPSVLHELSPGWLMLRDWRDVNGEPLPLDNRVFSYLFSVSAVHFGGAKAYFEHCVTEMQREKDAKEKTYTDERRDRQKSMRDYTLIKNIGGGSKFARHHDGTLLPGRSEQNWHASERKRTIPSEVAKDEAAQRELRRSNHG